MIVELSNFDKIELISFIDLTIDEKEVILTYRNHIEVRKWMHNHEKIFIDEHLRFIKKLESDIKNQYFLVKKDNKNIGVVYFNNIDIKKQECEFGLYANPFEKIAAIGRILEEVCIKYAFELMELQILKLEVLSKNIRALNLYKKYNFEETERKIVNDEEVICMELENENR